MHFIETIKYIKTSIPLLISKHPNIFQIKITFYIILFEPLFFTDINELNTDTIIDNLSVLLKHLHSFTLSVFQGIP